MIIVEDIQKDIKKHRILKEINFSLEDNQIVALVGNNGAGKTTLMKVISGILDINGGSIHVNNENKSCLLYTSRELRNKMGFVFQHFNLFPNMTVLENLTLAPIQVMKKSKSEAEEIACQYLKRVGLLDKKEMCIRDRL